MSTFTTEEIEKKLENILFDKYGIGEDPLNPLVKTADFQIDNGLDSLDFVELIMECEKEFNVAIPDEEAEKVKTFNDMAAKIHELLVKQNS